MRYLITQSLLSSWAYMFSCYESQCEEAYASFISTLKRERSEQTEAQKMGVEFETEVYKAVKGEPRQPHKWETGIQAVARLLTGAQLQVKEVREIEVDGEQYLLYGIMDALRAGEIMDVKFSTHSFGSIDLPGKYRESAQHPTYFALETKAYRFTYIVSDGEDVYTESYFRQSTPAIEGIISQFISSIKGMGLLDLYHQKWEAT